MKKQNRKKLALSRNTLRTLVPEKLGKVAGGWECWETAHDCSSTGGNQGSIYCSLLQP